MCPANYYCPAGVSAGTFCPDGTFSSTTGLEQAAQCTACPTGKYCTNGVVTGDCDPGYFCHSGAPSKSPASMICPTGHYCLVGSLAPTICDNGKVNPNTGGTSSAACVNCGLGKYCIQAIEYTCPAGHYCDGNNTPGNLDPKECPQDTYNPNTGASALTDCLPCPAGNYCSDTAIASLDFYKCDKGKYCPDDPSQGVLLTAIDCPSGTYNDERGLGDAN